MGSIIRDYTVEDLSLIDSTKEQCQELCWLALKNKGWKDRSKITAKMLGDGLTNHRKNVILNSIVSCERTFFNSFQVRIYGRASSRT